MTQKLAPMHPGQKSAKLKRKRDESSEEDISDDELDISSALTGKRAKKSTIAAGDSDQELNTLIHNSILKRNVKGGTKVLTKTKGKAKMVKGEVGGGSFQSMGTSFPGHITAIPQPKFLIQAFTRPYCVP